MFWLEIIQQTLFPINFLMALENMNIFLLGVQQSTEVKLREGVLAIPKSVFTRSMLLMKWLVSHLGLSPKIFDFIWENLPFKKSSEIKICGFPQNLAHPLQTRTVYFILKQK